MSHTPDPAIPTRAVPTQQGYDLWSHSYDIDENPLVALEEPVMEQLIGNVSNKTILDVGCGTGRHTARLANNALSVTAIDFSDGMLSQARAKPACGGVSFRVHDLSKPIPFENSSFDAVICGLVLDHIRNLDLIFGEMFRVCRNGGFAAISIMHPAMSLVGVQARFTDPSTNTKILCGSEENEMSDYVMAIIRAGWRIDAMIERSVDESLLKRMPKASKYENIPMLLAFRLIKWSTAG